MTVNLPAHRAAGTVAVRSSTAIAVRHPLPSRRPSVVLAGAGTASLASVVAGSVLTATTPGNTGPWLLAAGGIAGVVALLRAADLYRRPS